MYIIFTPVPCHNSIIPVGDEPVRMPAPLRVESGELTAAEIVDTLRDGRRIVVEAELLGGTHEVSLRHDGETYYCDTPTTLHKHPDPAGMIGCIERMGYAREE